MLGETIAALSEADYAEQARALNAEAAIQAALDYEVSERTTGITQDFDIPRAARQHPYGSTYIRGRAPYNRNQPRHRRRGEFTDPDFGIAVKY